MTWDATLFETTEEETMNETINISGEELDAAFDSIQSKAEYADSIHSIRAFRMLNLGE